MRISLIMADYTLVDNSVALHRNQVRGMAPVVQLA